MTRIDTNGPKKIASLSQIARSSQTSAVVGGGEESARSGVALPERIRSDSTGSRREFAGIPVGRVEDDPRGRVRDREPWDFGWGSVCSGEIVPVREFAGGGD